jgi:hypothetical protein
MSEPAGRFLALPLRRLIEMRVNTLDGDRREITVTEVRA